MFKILVHNNVLYLKIETNQAINVSILKVNN